MNNLKKLAEDTSSTISSQSQILYKNIKNNFIKKDEDNNNNNNETNNEDNFSSSTDNPLVSSSSNDKPSSSSTSSFIPPSITNELNNLGQQVSTGVNKLYTSYSTTNIMGISEEEYEIKRFFALGGGKLILIN